MPHSGSGYVHNLSSIFSLYSIAKPEVITWMFSVFSQCVISTEAFLSLGMLWFACSAAAAAACAHHFCARWAAADCAWAAATAPPSRGSPPRSEGWAAADSASHNPPLLPARPPTPSCCLQRPVPAERRRGTGHGPSGDGSLWRLH